MRHNIFTPRGLHSGEGGTCTKCGNRFAWRDLVRHPRSHTDKVCSPCAAIIRRDMASASQTPMLPTQAEPPTTRRLTSSLPAVLTPEQEKFLYGENK